MTPRRPAPAHGNTRWSLVAAAHGGNAAAPTAELCAHYWYAVYAWQRRDGHPPPLAQARTQAFLHRLVTERLAGLDSRSRRRFRDFVLDELRQAAAGEAPAGTPAKGVASPLPAGALEAFYLSDCGDCATPEQAFHAAFGHALVTRSVEILRDEAEAAGRGPLFARLQPFLSCDPDAAQQAAVCAALDARPLVVVLGLRSLRHRLRELIDREIEAATGEHTKLDRERRTLRIATPA